MTRIVEAVMACNNIKTHVSKDKIVVFILIASLWGFSTVPVLLFFLTPKSQKAAVRNSTLNVSETDELAYQDCRLTIDDAEDNLVKCSNEKFYFDNSTNVCVPNCYIWTSYTPATAVAIDGLVLFCSCIATLTSIAVIIIALIRRKSVFQFPSVLVVYMSLSNLLCFGIILIGYMDKYDLFCTSKNLVDNYLSPTPYCVLTGAIGDYYTVQLFIWVLCHIFSIYFLIFHPLQAKKLFSSSKQKYVHLCVVLVGLLAPLLGPLATILHNLSDQEDPERLGYRVVLYPPHSCFNSKTDIPFYTVILPSNFMLTLSISFLILILWKLLTRNRSTKVAIGTAEKKILVTLCYYTMYNFAWPTTLVVLIYRLEQYEQDLAAFFMCASADGVSDQLPQAHNPFNPVVVGAVWILGACFPLFLLAYVVDCQKLRKCVMEKRGTNFPGHWTPAMSQTSTKSQTI